MYEDLETTMHVGAAIEPGELFVSFMDFWYELVLIPSDQLYGKMGLMRN
jgi:hypothetical protein